MKFDLSYSDAVSEKMYFSKYFYGRAGPYFSEFDFKKFLGTCIYLFGFPLPDLKCFNVIKNLSTK
jgi:hypothetical protein